MGAPPGDGSSAATGGEGSAIPRSTILAVVVASLGYLVDIYDLILFTVVTTLLFHNFWAFEGGDYQVQMISFMKNLSITGGLLLVLAYGAGPMSVDGEDDEWA